MTDQEFFTVHHTLTVNVEPLAKNAVLPDQDAFLGEIPAPFIVASEFSHLDMLTDMAKAELKNNELKHVTQLLDTQNQKLNLLLSFMLSQQDDAAFRYRTTQFGASQFTYRANARLPVGHKVRAKLFIEAPAAAIYCYGEIIDCQVDGESALITIKYLMLREPDQDLLIKAALQQQQKLLRQRSKGRDNK